MKGTSLLQTLFEEADVEKKNLISKEIICDVLLESKIELTPEQFDLVILKLFEKTDDLNNLDYRYFFKTFC